MNTTDILSVIAKRDRTRARVSLKKVTAWVVLWCGADHHTHQSRRLYTGARARRVAARARRCGADAYVAVFGTVNVTKEQHAHMAGARRAS